MQSVKRIPISYVAPYALGLILAIALKYHYSVADSDDLQWVLYPTSRLVRQLTAISFEWEEHTGFVSRLHGIIIAPSCAGVNFLIILFSTIYFTTARLMPNGTWRILWIGIAFGISYILTLGVNGLRIVAAVSLYGADIYGGWLTPERAHRIEGTLIYFSFLLIANFCTKRIVRHFFRGHGKGLVWSMLAPFLWYCLMTLGIPLLNNALRKGGLRFMEHSALVLSVCAGVLLFSAVLSLLLQTAAIRIRRRRRGDSYPQEC